MNVHTHLSHWHCVAPTLWEMEIPGHPDAHYQVDFTYQSPAVWVQFLKSKRWATDSILAELAAIGAAWERTTQGQPPKTRRPHENN